MENLRLLETHRRRVALLVALLVFLLLYFVIILFNISSAYFKEVNENQLLINKSERVESVTLNYDTLIASGDRKLKKTIESILKGSEVYSQQRILNSGIGLDRDTIEWLEYDTIIKLPWWKLYKSSSLKWQERFTILVGMPYKTILEKTLPTLLTLLLLAPFIYSLFAWIWCRFMTQVYKPLRDIIISLESFASNVNHEFKTSLTEIVSSLELAKVTWEYKEANEHSISSARRLDSILNSLWGMIHFVNSDYRKQRVNLYKLANESVVGFKKAISEKEIKIVYKYPQNSSLYKYLDAEPFILCFQNILENAIKYSRQWGKIEITVTKDYFSITDYGKGISKKNLEKIFDRYFREWYSESGSGIGLSIIKKITEIYEWDIDVKSKKWDFTTVTLHF